MLILVNFSSKEMTNVRHQFGILDFVAKFKLRAARVKLAGELVVFDIPEEKWPGHDYIRND